MIRVSVVYGWGPQQVTIAESGDGEFQEPTTAIRTAEFDIEPDKAGMAGMWVIIETIGTHHDSTAIETDIFSDSTVQVGAWEAW